jgi:hypothetical protein
MSKQASNPANLAAMLNCVETDGEPGAAPKWDFNPDICGDFGIRIARDGTWFYRGSPIGRKSLCKLFSTVLRRDDEGNYYLVTPVEQGRIEVEDAPFTAVEVITDGAGQEQTVTFRTNLDHMVTAGPANHIRVTEDRETGEPSPYVLVRDNLEALILRPQFYQLVEMADERVENGVSTLGVWSSGLFFPLGTLEDGAAV